MTEIALKELHATIRFLAGWGGAVLIVGIMVFGYLHHRPPSSALAASVSATQREVQGLIQAQKALAASQGSTPLFSAPAVGIVSRIPGLRGFTDAQIAQMLAALKPPTVQVIGARLQTHVHATPPPAPAGWTQAQTTALVAADRSAVVSVLNDPKTQIRVSVKRQEVAPTRIGSFFSPTGSGLGYALIRRGHLELDAGIVQRSAHLSPALSFAYLIPHTSLAIGPSVTYDQGAHVGLAAVVHF